LKAVPTNEEWFCSACLFSQGDDFGFEEGDEHSIPSFQARDAAFAYDWWNRHRPGPSTSTLNPESIHRTFGKVAVTESDVEREFWRLTESATETVEIEYGADVHSTTHGR
jgi:histone demethylase JARID1